MWSELNDKVLHRMKILELLNESTINDSKVDEILHCHSKQIIDEELSIPVWKVKYTYTTARNNKKIAEKYMFLEEAAWDLVDQNFKNLMYSLNTGFNRNSSFNFGFYQNVKGVYLILRNQLF